MKHLKTSNLLAAAGFLAILLASPAPADPPQWRIFRPGKTGVVGDYSYTLTVDDQDRPWIAAFDPFREVGGMSRKNTDGTWMVLSNDDSPTIASPRFYHIAKAPNDVLWIGTWDSLLRYDPAVGNSSLQRFDASNSPLPAGTVRDVAVAPDGTVWSAVSLVSTVFGGLARYNPATNAWTVWNSNMPWASACNICSAVDTVEIQNDVAGGGYTVWFDGDGGGFGDMGMVSIHMPDTTFTWYGTPASIPSGAPITPTGFISPRASNDQNELLMTTNQGFAKRSPAGTYTQVPAPPITPVNLSVLTPLNNGRYGAASYLGEVYLHNGSTWQYLGNWNGNHTYGLDEESNGALWVCGIGGSARYANGQFQRYRLTNTGMVGYFNYALVFGVDGKVYINGNAGPGYGGFDIFDGARWTCVNNFNYGLGPVWGLPSDDVQAMWMRANGHLAISPAGIQGLLDWDGATYTYLIPQGFQIETVAEDTLGRLWAGQNYPNALSRVTGPLQYTNYTPGNSSLPLGDIRSIVPDPTMPGWVWVASMSGISHTDGEQWQVHVRDVLGLTEDSVRCLDRAADGTLWVGTGQGVFHFNPANASYTQYTTANSSLMTNVVNKIEIAPDGSIWIANRDNSTWPYPGGLTHFESGTWTTYTTSNSPLRHTQIEMLESRSVTGGYELWVGMTSEGVARLSVATPAQVPGDTNGDGIVNVQDLLAVITTWGACPLPPAGCPADLNHDAAVNVNDLLLVILNWS